MKVPKLLLFSLLATTLFGSYHVLADQKTPESRALLSPETGSEQVNQALLKLGEETFFEETFGNEVFVTDILGAFEGALPLSNMQKAIAALKGEATTDLKVELGQDVMFRGKLLKKGTLVSTGLDVAKGGKHPLGVPVVRSEGRLKAGFSCAACHATVDPVSKRVLTGVSNPDIDAGLFMALATNSASYFTHSNVNDLTPFTKGSTHTVVTSDGKKTPLPDTAALEKEVDETFAKWPRGTFDNTMDMRSNPTQIQDAFTYNDYPYSWTGSSMAGPFKGLSTLNNLVHAQNGDPLVQMNISREVFGVDKEVYIGTILQNAANPKYRYNPESGLKPSEFFAKIDPTPGVAGILKAVQSPTAPYFSLVTPAGVITGTPGHHVNEQNNAMSAYQDSLVPPKSPVKTTASALARGQAVFQRAGCASCHAGEYLTNHKVIPANVIGTDPSRALAWKNSERLFRAESLMYTPDTPIPVPPGAKIVKVPVDHLDPEQIKLAFARGDSPGGYKVQSLVGLYWSAPYLHDGGVAVGPDAKTQLGLPGTLGKGILPDPANSLKAMIDRDLRARVVAANHMDSGLRDMNVQGIGHAYWVDSKAGYTEADQAALIQYLLTRNDVRMKQN